MKNVFSFIVYIALLFTSFSLHSQVHDTEEEPQLNFDERTNPLPQNNTAYVDNIISFAKTFLGTPY